MPNASQVQVLMAPIALYREILRVHRNLPAAMRALGDDYVKSEFKRHKNIDNPAHIVGFVTQWQSYLDLMKEQTALLPNASAALDNELHVQNSSQSKDLLGKKLESGLLEKMSDEQIGQLYELRNEVKRSLEK